MLRITVRILGLLFLVLGSTLFVAHRVMHDSQPGEIRVVSLPKTTSVPGLFKSPLKGIPIQGPEPGLMGTVALGFESFVASDPPIADIPFAIFGAALIVESFFLPKGRRKFGELVLANGVGMAIPENWDERQISLDIERYRADQGMLGAYLGGIVRRFIAGQNQQTIEARTRYLERWNRYAEVSRQSFHWQRYLKGGRAALEEDIADLQIQARLKKAQGELEEVGSGTELRHLQREAEELDAKLAIAQKKKRLEELNNPTPPSTEVSREPNGKERSISEMDDLRESEKNVREAIEAVKVDKSIPEELRRRKLNALEERLAEIYDRQVALL